jgi:hypothetical protein
MGGGFHTDNETPIDYAKAPVAMLIISGPGYRISRMTSGGFNNMGRTQKFIIQKGLLMRRRMTRKTLYVSQEPFPE